MRRSALGRTLLAIVAVLALSAGLVPGALADHDEVTTITGSPLTVHVGYRGQLQAFRAGDPTGIFYNPTDQVGDAGFFLAFPAGIPGSATPAVYGFDGRAGPDAPPVVPYTPTSRDAPTGVGTAASPRSQVTRYTAGPLQIAQTTTYVNGTSQFRIRWLVHNSAGVPVRFKALAAADFYFDGSDRGTGIYVNGPPRFIGGTNADSGNSGGFSEVTGAPSPSPPWSAYQALPYGGDTNEVWGEIENAAATSTATFDNSVVGTPVDNAGAVEWDQYAVIGLPPNGDQVFELIAKSAVPQPLQLTPPNAGSPRGVPIRFTATAKNSEGVPYAGQTLRYRVLGANPGSGSVGLNGAGSAVITDPGTRAGADTVVAFVDFNKNGVREPVEPQASALGTFVDNVAPSCKVKVSGDRPGGGGAGKPLVISVNCNEPAQVKVSTTLTPLGAASARADAAARRRRRKPIRLKAVTRTVQPGRSVPLRLKIPRSVRRKYAGRTLRARVTIKVTDPSKNVRTIKRSKKIKLRKLSRKRR
jgi:hypothetical protein